MKYALILLALLSCAASAWETVPGKSPTTMIGTSSETKPVLGNMPGALFYESDSGKWFMWTGDKDGSSSDWDQAGEGVVVMNLLVCEDATNSVCKVEQQFSKAVDDADLVVKNSAGFLHSVWCYEEDAAPTAGTVRITNTTAAGGAETTEVWGKDITTTVGSGTAHAVLDIVMDTGIVIDFTTTADVKCGVSYR